MLLPVGAEPRAADSNTLFATVWTNSPFGSSPRPLDPYIALLYWFLEIFENNYTGGNICCWIFCLFPRDSVESSTECISI